MEILKTMPGYELVWLTAGESLQVTCPQESCVLGPVDAKDKTVVFLRNALALLEIEQGAISRVLWSYQMEQLPLLRDLRFWNQQHWNTVPRLKPLGIKKSTRAFVAEYRQRHEVPFAKFRAQHFAVTHKDWKVVPTTRLHGKSSFILLDPEQAAHFRDEYKNRKKRGYIYPLPLPFEMKAPSALMLG